MKKILVVKGTYLPSLESGGPVRSTINLIDLLGSEYDIRVVCYNCGHDGKPYVGIKLYEWNTIRGQQVYYIERSGYTKELLKKLIQEFDIVYIWGCFDDYARRILELKRKKQITASVVIASMGIFSPKAFKIHYAKKKSYMMMMTLLGMFRDVYWSVSTEMEAKELSQQVYTNRSHIFIAKDLPREIKGDVPKKEKQKGQLKICWISRIDRKKNLAKAIQILQKIKSNIHFTIYGPVFDPKYFEECEKKLDKLPYNVTYEIKGYIDSEQVLEALKNEQVFLFPTLGENYGHVIQEALSAGCPVILSDQTPWQDLEENQSGYVFPLEEEDKFVQAIENYAAMEANEFQSHVEKAFRYAKKQVEISMSETGYRRIFDEL